MCIVALYETLDKWNSIVIIIIRCELRTNVRNVKAKHIKCVIVENSK